MPSRPDPDVSSAIEAMKQAAESLADTAGPRPTVAPQHPPASGETRYHQDLRQRGQLVDVDDSTDLATLPPEVTHVCMPDGRVRRLGYS